MTRRERPGPATVGLPVERLDAVIFGLDGVLAYTDAQRLAEQKDAGFAEVLRAGGVVEQDRYCIDVLTQVSAATRALQQVALGLITDHLHHCVVDAARSDPTTGQAKLDELTGTLRHALRM